DLHRERDDERQQKSGHGALAFGKNNSPPRTPRAPRKPLRMERNSTAGAGVRTAGKLIGMISIASDSLGVLRVLGGCNQLFDFSKAWSRSQRMSSMSSMPIDKRIMSGDTPALICSSSESWRWVVDAGWMTSVFASPTLARCEKNCNDSMNLMPASTPPLMPKVRIDPQPLGRYFCASL